MWTEITIPGHIKKLSNDIKSQNWNSDLITKQWESISVVLLEDTSQIKLPSKPSALVVEFLWNLICDLNSIAGITLESVFCFYI